MTRRDFRTPSTVPEGYITRCITIPASQEWLGLVNAALLMLTEPWRYTQVFDTDLTPAETAAIAFDMYVAYLTGCEVDMECSDVIACMLPYIQAQQIAGGVVRLDPVTDEPQVSYDGGVTWSDVPQSPQPVQTPTPTPTPGSDDAARICLASTRAALIIAEFYSQTFGAFTADLLNTLNSINQFLHTVNTGLFNLIYSPYEGILESAGWFDFDFTTNYTAATLTTEQVEDITCLLVDNATVDGSGIVTFNHAAVQAALISVLGVNPGTAVTLNVSNMRSEGLQAASQVNVTDTGNCGPCTAAWEECSFDGDGLRIWTQSSARVWSSLALVAGSYDSVNDQWLGAYQGRVGGTGPYFFGAVIDMPMTPQIITRVEADGFVDPVNFNAGASGTFSIVGYLSGSIVFEYGVTGSGVKEIVWTGSETLDRIDIVSRGANTNGAAYVTSITRVCVTGEGINPF